MKGTIGMLAVTALAFLTGCGDGGGDSPSPVTTTSTVSRTTTQTVTSTPKTKTATVTQTATATVTETAAPQPAPVPSSTVSAPAANSTVGPDGITYEVPTTDLGLEGWCSRLEIPAAVRQPHCGGTG